MKDSKVSIVIPNFNGRDLLLKNLPKVIEFDGRLHKLTGWNSDYGQAYYKTGQLVARSIGVKDVCKGK